MLSSKQHSKLFSEYTTKFFSTTEEECLRFFCDAVNSKYATRKFFRAQESFIRNSALSNFSFKLWVMSMCLSFRQFRKQVEELFSQIKAWNNRISACHKRQANCILELKDEQPEDPHVFLLKDKFKANSLHSSKQRQLFWCDWKKPRLDGIFYSFRSRGLSTCRRLSCSWSGSCHTRCLDSSLLWTWLAPAGWKASAPE